MVLWTVFVYFLLIFVCVVAKTKDQQCGEVASGNPIHQHPYLAYLEFHFKRQIAKKRCGGILLDSRHVLTSAHCAFFGVYPVVMKVRLGEYDTTSKVDCVQGVCSDPVVLMGVQSVHIHPDYRRGKVNDLAILVLNTEAPYTDTIRPVCLPTGSLDVNTVFFAAGFGKTPYSDRYSNIKKSIPLPYYPNCWGIYKTLSEDLFCAGGVRNFDTCEGDSGGPLVRLSGGRAEIWGVTKGGQKDCGIYDKPGVYTSVPYHLDWIREVIGMPKKEVVAKNSGYKLACNFYVLIFVSIVLFGSHKKP